MACVSLILGENFVRKAVEINWELKEEALEKGEGRQRNRKYWGKLNIEMPYFLGLKRDAFYTKASFLFNQYLTS